MANVNNNINPVETPRGPVFLRALAGAAIRVPLLFFSWLVPLLFAAVLAYGFVDWFDQTAAHRYEPGSLRASLDAVFRFDQGTALGSLRENAARAAVPILFLMMLWGVFSAGGWLQVFLGEAKGNSLRRFLVGGAKHFLRFLRVWILTLLVLSLVTWLCFGWPWEGLLLEMILGLRGGELELLESETCVLILAWTQAGVHALLFALTLSWADYTRTRLALQDSRSALWSGLCTALLILRHPVQTLRPALLIFLIEFLAVWFLGGLSWRWSTEFGADAGVMQLLMILGLGQALMIFQTIARAARYHAAVALSRTFVPPASSPDPWAKRIGGPGGPQYPIDDEEDFAISL
ncbi:MAG: hypothetical protein ACI82F_002898 [Planctomycetota bacterium]